MSGPKVILVSMQLLLEEEIDKQSSVTCPGHWEVDLMMVVMVVVMLGDGDDGVDDDGDDGGG